MDYKTDMMMMMTDKDYHKAFSVVPIKYSIVKKNTLQASTHKERKEKKKYFPGKDIWISYFIVQLIR